MKLTVGRIVHVYASYGTRVPMCEFGWSGHKAALVTHIGPDFAKLRVFLGEPTEDLVVKVSLTPEGTEQTDGFPWRWRWPPRES